MAMGDLARLPRPDEDGESQDVPLDPWQRAAIAAQALEQRAPPQQSAPPPNMGSLYGMAGAGEAVAEVPSQFAAGAVGGIRHHLENYYSPQDALLGTYDPEQRGRQVEQLKGIEAGYPEPTGAPGRYARSIGGAVANPINYLGIGPASGAGWAAASGLGSEFLGNQYKGTAAEPFARAVGGATPFVLERIPQMSRAVPSGNVGSFGGKIIQPEVPAIIEPAGRTAGIRAYHSSPHDFEKFDFSPARARSGEGAQMYGEGGYFAENPAVSGQGGEYWTNFADRFKGPERLATNFLHAADFNRKEAYSMLRQAADNGGVPGYLANDALALLRSEKPVGPRTYEVNIAAHPEEMLDWDNPLAPQSMETLRRAGMDAPASDITPTGMWAYNNLVRGRAPEGASRALNEAGIPGIRYLDQGSRFRDDSATRKLLADYQEQAAKHKAAWAVHGLPPDPFWEEGIARLTKKLEEPLTYNYVMFPGTEDKVHIMAKYGLAGAVPTMGSLADMSYREQ